MLAKKWSDLLIALALTFFGAVIGGVIQTRLANPDIDLTYCWLLLTVVIAWITCGIVLCCTPTIPIKALVDKAFQHMAEIIPRDSVYPEMAKCIRQAEEQVVVMTYYMYDWAQGKRTFLPPEQVVTGKEEFYAAINECIAKHNVEYVRIWQVPEEHHGKVLDIIREDPLHKEEVELIQEMSPDVARLVIAPVHTTASFILIDRKHLFINLDFYDPDRNLWLSPYMIFIKDASGLAFTGLNSIIVRLMSRKFVTK
jgi:hypothetical protein